MQTPATSQNGDGNGSIDLGYSQTLKKQLTLNKNKSLTKNIGVPEEDIHVCVSCLRAIMNNKVFCPPPLPARLSIHGIYFSTGSTWSLATRRRFTALQEVYYITA